MMPEFRFFSPEELRCHTYAAGVIFSPTPLPTDLPPIPMTPSSPLSKTPPIIHPFFAKDTPASAFFKEANPIAHGPMLCYCTITANGRYTNHSLEELRIAYLQAGRELDSFEISRLADRNGAPSSPTSSSGSSGSSTVKAGGIFSHSPVVRPF